jgi:hypothetical protein
MTLPILPRDVVVHQLLSFLTIQDMLMLIAHPISRDWLAWTRQALHINVRHMPIVMKSTYEAPFLLSATEQVTSSEEHLVRSDDGQWKTHRTREADDTFETLSQVEHCSHAHDRYLCYRAPPNTCIEVYNDDVNYTTSSCNYDLSTHAQVGMTAEMQTTEHMTDHIFEEGKSYDSFTGHVTLVSTGTQKTGFLLVKVRVPFVDMTLLWSSVRDATRWIRIMVLRTDRQQCAWFELMTWYIRIGRKNSHATAEEMHALAVWCVRGTQQQHVTLIDKFLLYHADAPERLVDSRIWISLVQEPTTFYKKIIEWRTTVDKTHSRKQRCEQLLAAVSARGGCIADDYACANTYLEDTPVVRSRFSRSPANNSSSLHETVDMICDATFMRQHTDYIAREFRVRAENTHAEYNLDQHKNKCMIQSLQAIPHDSPHAVRAQDLLSRLAVKNKI